MCFLESSKAAKQGDGIESNADDGMADQEENEDPSEDVSATGQKRSKVSKIAVCFASMLTFRRDLHFCRKLLKIR